MTAATSTSKRRHALRLIAWGAALFAALCVVLVVSLATPPGRSLLAAIIERLVTVDGINIRIDNISGWPPFRFNAGKVMLTDADGTFAEIDNLGAKMRAGSFAVGNIAFAEVTADRVSIVRQPHLVAEPSTGDATPFAIDKLAIARVDLGQSLTGRGASLSLNGAYASHSSGRIDAALKAERIDGAAGKIDATLHRDASKKPLALDVKAEEGADGILIGLMGREAGPAYRLAAKSTVNGSNIEGTLTLASGGAAQFDGRFSTTGDNDTHRIVASGNGDLGELLPVEFSGLLSGPIRIAIDADWKPAAGASLPRLVIRQGSIATTNVHAEASGTLDNDTADLAAKLDIAKPGGGAIAVPMSSVPARFDSIALTAKATPVNGLMRIAIDGKVNGLDIAGASLPRSRVSLSVTSAEAGAKELFARGNLPFDLRIDTDSIVLPSGRIAAKSGAPIVLGATGTLDSSRLAAQTTAKLVVDDLQATFAGVLSRESVNGTATAHLPALAALSPFIGRKLAGALDANAEGTFVSSSGLNVKLQATTTNLDPGETTLARLLAGKAQVVANVVRRPDGALSVSGLAIDASALNLHGKASLTGPTIDAALEGSFADLSVLAKDTSGAAQFALNASGAMVKPKLDATLKLDRGQLLGKPVEMVVARVQGQPSSTGWSASLSVEGGYAGKRIRGGADATLDTATNRLAFPRIDVAVGDNRISGALQRSAQGTLTGTLDVAAPDVATLAALAFVDAAGAANGKVVFGSGGTRQSLAITFNGRGLAYQTISAGVASGTVDIDDAFGVPKFRGNVSAAPLVAGGLRLDAAKATATVEGTTTRFTASATNSDLDLSAAGSLAPAQAGNVVTLASLSGTAYKFPVRLAAPVTIRFDGDAASINGARLALGGGTLRADGAVSPALDVSIVAEKVSAGVINGFVPTLGAEGTLDASAKITGRPASLSIAWKADWTGLRLAATKGAGLPALAIAAQGLATTVRTSIDAKVTGAGSSFTVKGDVPYAGAGLSVHAEGSAPLALLALQSTRELRLAGTARVDVNVTGAVDAPQFSGTGDLVGATIADTDTGFGVTGANGRITFDGQRATLGKITGRLAQGGEVTLTGTVDVAAKGLPAALKAKVDNGRYADGKIVNAGFNANLSVDGPLLGNATVSGTLALGRTEVQLPDKLGSRATAIEVRHTNAKPGFRDPLPRREAVAADSGSTAQSLRIAIDITNTGGIFVRGFGVDAEFGGSLKLAGTIDAPQAVGAFTLRRGRIELLGKRFDLSSGKLTFAGDLIPLLDFTATATASSSASASGDTTVTLTITGPANDPAIAFTSVPDLPQEEILARLLFQRSVGSLSPLQAAQLVDALASLTGIGGGTSMFARIRQATGLDDLDVRQNAAGGTTVGVSKGVSDRVRLGVEAGSGSTAGRVTIDLEVTKDLKARGEAGQDGSGKVGLTWEHEY